MIVLLPQRRRLLAAGLLLAVIASHTTAVAAQATAVEPILGADICDADRGVVSPDGSRLLLMRDMAIPPHITWGAPGTSVYETDCLLREEDWRLCGHTSFPQSDAVTWTPDNRVLMWRPEVGLQIGIHPSGALHTVEEFPTRDVREAPHLWMQGSVAVDSVQRALRDAYAQSGARRIHGAIVTTSGQRVMIASQRAVGYAEYRFGASGAFRSAGAHASRGRRYILDNLLRSGTPARLIGQLVFIPSGRTATYAREDRALTTPIIDSSSGEVVGLSGPPRWISMRGNAQIEQTLSELVSADVGDGRRLLLRQIDVNLGNRTAVISYVVGLRARAFRVVRWLPNAQPQSSSYVRCPAAPESSLPGLSLSRLDDVQTQFVDLGTSDWQMPGVLLDSEHSSRRLMVYLHGGPSDPSLSLVYAPRWRRYLELGYDVFVPVVSGGADLGPHARNRLRQGPVRALSRDASILASFLTGDFGRDYDRVVIHSESFSAGLALEVSRRMPSPSVALVLVSPWLGYRAPRAWAANPSEQEAYEARELGFETMRHRREYFDWVARLVAEAPASRPTLIVLGAADNRIDVAPVRQMQAAGAAEVVSLNGLGHDAVMATRPSWNATEEFLRRRGQLD